MNITLAIGVICGALSISGAALAQGFPEPTGKVILTLSGEAAGIEPNDKIQFDLEGLESLGMSDVVTSTIWTEGVLTFTGVPLSTIVERLNVEDGTIRASAINDYLVEIPVEDAVKDGPIIASRVNGKEMSVRDKGPLWVIYPYDSNQDYRTEVVYSRSIWQLDRMEFVD